MTKLDLWQKMKDRAGDGPSPARNTLDNLKTTTRAPQPRIVRAIADVLGIDWQLAQELAGLVPRATSTEVDVRDAIERSAAYSDRQKGALLGLLDFLDGEREDAERESQRRGRGSA